MGKIQELSETLANQIAAGEVVERPASVVKELVENAIDAGATQIDVRVVEAGLRMIQIVDNGEGIAPEDVLSAFKRHATSKIHSRDDLFRIRTLGFRGEALPSIASVSQLTLETATKDSSEGSYLKLSGGTVEEHRLTALRVGTKITVENLFFNTPARLKYVKSLQTELSNIGDIINRLALSHPNIAFRLAHDTHQMMTTAGNGDLKQALAGIYGVSIAKKMLEIETHDLDFRVHGYISLPEVTRAGRNYISTIINGRYIKNFALNKALISGYGSKLMVGRFPVAVIEIEMDPLLVDVNVHPTKQEVRLSKEVELTKLISAAVQAVLQEENLIPSAADNLRFKKKVAHQEKVEQLEMPLPNATPVRKPGDLGYNPQTGSFYIKGQPTSVVSDESKATLSNSADNQVAPSELDVAASRAVGQEVTAEETETSVDEAADNPLEITNGFNENNPEVKSSTETSNNLPTAAGKAPINTMPPASFLMEAETELEQSVTVAPEIVAADEEVYEAELSLHPEIGSAQYQKELQQALAQVEKAQPKERFPELEYFGQMHGTYLFAQSKTGLYIIDQHAAQERIKYEYFREKIGEVSDSLQELLVPIVLDYPNSDALKLREKIAELATVGIHLEEFGQNSFIVRSHPTWYPAGEEESIIREMIDMLLLTGSVSVKKFREATAIMMSCKRSIKANHYVNEAQARVLLTDLAQCENPFNCPHGRPVLIHFTNSDMERMFKRIQDPH